MKKTSSILLILFLALNGQWGAAVLCEDAFGTRQVLSVISILTDGGCDEPVCETAAPYCEPYHCHECLDCEHSPVSDGFLAVLMGFDLRELISPPPGVALSAFVLGLAGPEARRGLLLPPATGPPVYHLNIHSSIASTILRI